MKRVDQFFVLAVALLGIMAGLGALDIDVRHVYAQTGANRQFHVTLNSIPGSLTSPATIEGGPTNTAVNVDWIVIVNTDSSAHTVTIEDCTPTTPFLLYGAYSIAANTTWSTPYGNTRFNGCLKWSASSTLVQGSIVGTR